MILRGTPKHPEAYVRVDSDTTVELARNGFTPFYIDNQYTYFKKDDEIIEFMLERGLHNV